jgi:drug/metabolite transporter (DMT)-like permease
LPEGETYPPGICDENAGGGGMWPRGTLADNIPELIPWFIFLYFLSTCISSFISGFYLNRKQLHPKTHYWQSLISGLIIGAGGTIIFINSLVNELYTRMDVTNIAGVITRGLIFGLSSTLVALIGYYVRGRGKESL